MLYLWRHNDFRVESCSCIEKSGKLEVSREQDITRTHVVRVVCCLSLTGYQSLQYVSLRLRTFFCFLKIVRISCNVIARNASDEAIYNCRLPNKSSSRKPPLAGRVMYEENCDCDDIAVVGMFICGTMLFPNKKEKLRFGYNGQENILRNDEKDLSRYSILR